MQWQAHGRYKGKSWGFRLLCLVMKGLFAAVADSSVAVFAVFLLYSVPEAVTLPRGLSLLSLLLYVADATVAVQMMFTVFGCCM